MVKQFFKDKRGSASVEFVLWLPIFVLILVLVVNTSTVLHKQAKMYDAARDGARMVATGAMDVAQAELHVKAKFPQSGYIVDINPPAPDVGDTFQSRITVRAADIVPLAGSAVGALFGQGWVQAEVVMVREN